jgi:hypothetical protein
VNRRLVLVSLLALSGGASCSPMPNALLAPAWMRDTNGGLAEEVVLVLSPAAEAVRPFLESLRSELGTELRVVMRVVDAHTSAERIGVLVQEESPDAVVLVDNTVAACYGRWARQVAQPPPAVIALASFAERLRASIPNASGVLFEPPAVTTLMDARRLLDVPFERVGVVCREGFEEHFENERKLALRENIELVAEIVQTRPSSRDVTLALERLSARHISVLWVSNDDKLLSPELLSASWIPFAKRRGLPAVVGVPSLIGGMHPLGTYAAVPNLEGLGLQVADMVFDLKDRAWNNLHGSTEPPLSIVTYLDVARARRFGMRDAIEAHVDVLVNEGAGH